MILGIRTQIWTLFIITTSLILMVFLTWYYRKKFKEYYLKFRFPNYTYRIILFFPNGNIATVWEKLNRMNQFRIGKNVYNFDEKAVYNTFRGYSSLFYYEKSPNPIKFDISKHNIKITSKDIAMFKDEDLIQKLLMVDIGEKLIRLLLILSFIQIGAIAYLIFGSFGV